MWTTNNWAQIKLMREFLAWVLQCALICGTCCHFFVVEKLAKQTHIALLSQSTMHRYNSVCDWAVGLHIKRALKQGWHVVTHVENNSPKSYSIAAELVQVMLLACLLRKYRLFIWHLVSLCNFSALVLASPAICFFSISHMLHSVWVWWIYENLETTTLCQPYHPPFQSFDWA